MSYRYPVPQGSRPKVGWPGLWNTPLTTDEPSDQYTEDGWDHWASDGGELDDLSEIVATTQPTAEPSERIQEDQLDSFSSDDGYEDPVVDLMEACTGPVQANAPPLDMPPEDAWAWVDEDTEEWTLFESAQPQAADPPSVDPTPEDGWLWLDDDLGDEWPLDETLQADAPAEPEASYPLASDLYF